MIETTKFWHNNCNFHENNLEISMPTVNSNTAAQFALNKMTLLSEK